METNLLPKRFRKQREADKRLCEAVLPQSPVSSSPVTLASATCACFISERTRDAAADIQLKNQASFLRRTRLSCTWSLSQVFAEYSLEQVLGDQDAGLPKAETGQRKAVPSWRALKALWEVLSNREDVLPAWTPLLGSYSHLSEPWDNRLEPCS